MSALLTQPRSESIRSARTATTRLARGCPDARDKSSSDWQPAKSSCPSSASVGRRRRAACSTIASSASVASSSRPEAAIDASHGSSEKSVQKLIARMAVARCAGTSALSRSDSHPTKSASLILSSSAPLCARAQASVSMGSIGAGAGTASGLSPVATAATPCAELLLHATTAASVPRVATAAATRPRFTGRTGRECACPTFGLPRPAC